MVGGTSLAVSCVGLTPSPRSLRGAHWPFRFVRPPHISHIMSHTVCDGAPVVRDADVIFLIILLFEKSQATQDTASPTATHQDARPRETRQESKTQV